MRLTPATPAPVSAQDTSVRWPAYDPEKLGIGILHLGLGAFARAHLCAYTDAALAAGSGDWRVLGASLRGTEVAEALNPQGGRYTLLVRSDSTQANVVGSLAGVLAGPKVGAEILAAMQAPGCRIVSLTVTEKGYGLLRTGGCDLDHAAVAADLAQPDAPSGVLGLLAMGLKQRFDAGLAPFTVMSCDNLPDNGHLLRQAVIDFARRAYGADLADRIAAEVAFPATMVDRITPRSTQSTFADAAQLIGAEDLAAVETEPFAQWVIEDHFSAGRPAWEAMGATFTANVRPYEAMKLRMLNGSHSMLAYAGFLSGKTYVRDVMADPSLSALVARHLGAAAASLPAGDLDLAGYASALEARFANPAIAHATAQIAMDGSQKMPQRIFAAACDTLANGGDLAAFAFATAAWMRYALGRDDAGQVYGLNDPREAEILTALQGAESASAIFDALAALPELLPAALSDGDFRNACVSRLETM
uniref:mannitol dehydrogenase family protein n=1 Tax=Paracoccus sp. TaxID=267 RepID=UPI002898C5EF